MKAICTFKITVKERKGYGEGGERVRERQRKNEKKQRRETKKERKVRRGERKRDSGREKELVFWIFLSKLCLTQ